MPNVTGALEYLGANRLVALPWGLLSIPGFVLSRRAQRVARTRHAPEGPARAGVVLGIVGTVFVVLYFAFWALLIWGLTHGSIGE